MDRTLAHSIYSGVAACIIYVVISIWTADTLGPAIGFGLILGLGTTIVTYIITLIVSRMKR